MRLVSLNMRSTAIAALFSLPIAGGAALAQDQPAQDQQAQDQQAQDQQAQDQQAGTSPAGQAAGDEQPDTVVATVGESEIRSSDVMTVIGMLPPQLQSQPVQMLVPMALEQLILRELILEEARGLDLANDPDVVALVEDAGQSAQDDAMVQVWLDREFANAVTDQAVQQVYDEAQAKAEQELPAVEQLRPEIEQYLRQQKMQEIQARLRQGAEVVFYDPSGQPVQQQGDAQQAPGAQAGGNAGAAGAEGSGDNAEQQGGGDAPADASDGEADGDGSGADSGGQNQSNN